MPFHDGYTVEAGDNLSTIARNHGFQNPIGAYPPNQSLYRGRSGSGEPGAGR